jgi:hypothetical protein
MEEIIASETSIDFCITTRRNIPEDGYLQTFLTKQIYIIVYV